MFWMLRLLLLALLLAAAEDLGLLLSLVLLQPSGRPTSRVRPDGGLAWWLHAGGASTAGC